MSPTFPVILHSPAEDTEDQVEHEEGPDDDEGDEVDGVVRAADGVVHLEHQR